MKFRQYDTTSVEPQPLEAADVTSNRIEVVRRLLRTRAMLQESRNRSAELQGALERFKYQQSKIDGR